VALSGFGAVADAQMGLFPAPERSAPDETERDRRLAHAVDAVRSRFGRSAIRAADERR
jgi:hypothetical protein